MFVIPGRSHHGPWQLALAVSPPCLGDRWPGNGPDNAQTDVAGGTTADIRITAGARDCHGGHPGRAARPRATSPGLRASLDRVVASAMPSSARHPATAGQRPFAAAAGRCCFLLLLR